MPRGRYSNLSVRREVREELDKLREELRINDLSDLLILLVKTYRDYTNTVSKLEDTLTNAVSKAVREAISSLTNTVSTTAGGKTPATSISSSMETSSHATKGSMDIHGHVTQGSKRKTAVEVLREVKVRCVSEMRGARNPEAVIDKMKAGGAVIVRTDEDVCAVDPEYWDLFKRRLNEIKTPDDREVLSKLRDEKMKRLFQLLRKPGALYLDNKTREWVYDHSFIEEPGDRRREEEETPVDWDLA
jgi:hypothetical protein